jgi:hypothetical protein
MEFVITRFSSKIFFFLYFAESLAYIWIESQSFIQKEKFMIQKNLH